MHTASCGGAFNLISYQVFAENAGQVCTMKTENRLFSKKAGKWLSTAAGDFPSWKERGVDWFAGISDWGAMAAGVRAFKAECDKVREV